MYENIHARDPVNRQCYGLEDMESTLEMAELEKEALGILNNRNLSPSQRRKALNNLLSSYSILKEYQAALEAFIIRMREWNRERSPTPDEIVQEIMRSSEFSLLNQLIVAVLIAVAYGGGPQSHWIPMTLLPLPEISSTGWRH